MRLEEINKRMAAIGEEIGKEGANLDALNVEVDELKEERQAILDTAEKRKSLMDEVANMANVTVLEKHKEERGAEKVEKEFGADSKEYRNAFLKTLLGERLTDVEERAYLHTTENTEAVIPKELQNKIYSTMEEQHPILQDIQILRTGTVLSIVKHVSIDEGDAKVVAEGDANVDEKNMFVNVPLTGKDFSKHVDFSYRLGKMAIPAFEEYLVKEIGNRIGSAMADDIVAQIKSDMNAKNKIETGGLLTSAHFLGGLAKLKQTGRVFVYANNATLYGSIAQMEGNKEKLTFLNNLQDNVSAQILGKGIKEEDAVPEGELLILDPQQFIYNVVQDVMLERDRDIKKHVHTISGFAIAGGTLTNDKAAALVTVTAGA